MNLQDRAIFAALDQEQKATAELRGEAIWTCEHVLGTRDIEITEVKLGEKRVWLTCDDLEFRAGYIHVDGALEMALEMRTGDVAWMAVPDLATLGRWLRGREHREAA